MGALRISLAIAVLAFHSYLRVLGPYAVYVFFMLSGYAIFSGLKISSQKEFFVRNFLRRRFKKRLPPYLLSCLAISMLCIWYERTSPNSSQTLVMKNSGFRELNFIEMMKT